MKFTEEKAKEIVQKHGLSEKTLAVWRSRNKIPDKYANEGFEKRQSLTRKDTQSYNRLLEVLSLKGLNKTAIAEISGISPQTLIDVRRKEYKLSEQQLIALKSTINQLKIDIAKVFTHSAHEQRKRALKALLNRPELWLKPIFHDFDKNEYDILIRFKLGKTDEPGDMERIKEKLTIFTMQL